MTGEHPNTVTSSASAARCRLRRSPVVLLAGKTGATAAPGGGEIQMLALCRALRRLGTAARLWRPWNDSLLESGDCLHLFGSLPEHLPLVEAARRRSLPVALSTIAWFQLASYWREPRSLPGRVAASARFIARAACPRLPSWRRQLYNEVDLLLPNSQAEARQLVETFHGERGGFVANVLRWHRPEYPPANVAASIEAFDEFR